MNPCSINIWSDIVVSEKHLKHVPITDSEKKNMKIPLAYLCTCTVNVFYSGGNGSSGEASCLSHTKDIRYLAVGSAWFVSAEELVGSDQGRFSEK